MFVLQLKFFHPELISPFNEKQDELEIIWQGGEEYFKAERSSFENNFYKVLADTQTPNSQRTELYDRWKNHVIELRGNGTNAPHAGTTQNGYLVSWKFFINVILRDTRYGLMSLFQVDSDPKGPDAATLSLVRKV